MQLKKDRAAKIILSLIVIAGIAGCTGIIPEELTLLRTCWEEGEEECDPETEEDIMWYPGSIPLTVLPIESDLSPLSIESMDYKIINQAVRDTNSQLGFMMYEISAVNPEILLLMGGPPPPTATERSAGFCRVIIDRKMFTRGLIWIKADLDVRVTYRTIIHELGHSAGLVHDDFQGSIMYHAETDSVTAKNMTLIRFTDADVRKLREVYNGGRRCRRR